MPKADQIFTFQDGAGGRGERARLACRAITPRSVHGGDGYNRVVDGWLAKPVAPPAPSPGAPATDDESGARARGSADLVCTACGRLITHDDHRMAVGDAREHTFVNPGGFVHQLGCFAVATRLSYRGPTETAFSWFPGFSWQLAHCGACATHLGWIFRCAGDLLHRLWRDRLVRRGT